MKSKLLAVDCRISRESERNLVKMGYNLIKIPQSNLFDTPISAHPDMFIAKINNYLFVDSTIHNMFTNIDAKVIVCSREEHCDKIRKYPFDIEFNCVQVGDKLICNKKYTNKAVVEYATNNGITIIDVKQGYAKCSTCVVNSNAIITEDESIAEKALENGIEVLKISKSGVGLSGYEYGFIGGACGLIEENLLAFNGDVYKHPEFYRIFEFCYNRSVGIVSLSGENLCDIGSVIRIA